MTFLVRTIAAALTALLILSATPREAPAAGGDLGYDALTKFSTGQDGAPVPGNFAADFAAATATQPKPAGHMPFGLGKMIASVQNAGSMLKTGTPSRHWDGTTKYREDNLAAGTGDITDCTARTITHLDLNAKTYTVTSLDHPEQPVSSDTNAKPGPAPTDDGTKISMAVTNKALGPMTIDGVATQGYDLNIKMTITKPTGESGTTNEDMVSYFSTMPEPIESCPARPIDVPSTGPNSKNGAAASAAMMAIVMQGLNSKGNSRFKVTSSGPPLPGGRFPMWTLMKLGNAAGGDSTGATSGFGIVTEHGNVHPVSDSDPAFGIPAGFTKV